MRFQIIACDKCGIREEKKTVQPWTARRGHTRYQGELCEKCWAELVEIFHPTTLTKARHQIVITSIDDIPKKA